MTAWKPSKLKNTAAATPWEWDTTHIDSILTQWEDEGDTLCVEKWLRVSGGMAGWKEPVAYFKTSYAEEGAYLTEASGAAIAGMPRRAIRFLFTKDVPKHRLIAHDIDCTLDRSQLRQLILPTT